jgi:hypothetical protein
MIPISPIDIDTCIMRLPYVCRDTYLSIEHHFYILYFIFYICTMEIYLFDFRKIMDA